MDINSYTQLQNKYEIMLINYSSICSLVLSTSICCRQVNVVLIIETEEPIPNIMVNLIVV